MDGSHQSSVKRARQKATKTNTKQTAGDASSHPSGSNPGRSDGEAVVLAAIAAMPEPYRTMGGRVHDIIRTNAPSLQPRLWYGMPAFARDGEVVCFFRSGDKFKERYMTIGFNEVANLDEGNMWPVAFALTTLTADEEERIAALVRKAVR